MIANKAKKKLKSIPALVEEVATLLQKIVRLKAADKNGMVQCVTCSAIKHYKKMQGGHYIERTKLYTKLMEECIHPQCPYCNHYGMKKASVVLAYRRYMCDMYGQRFVATIEARCDDEIKFDREELGELKKEYKALIKELEAKLES